jgi:hypothetical protein
MKRRNFIKTAGITAVSTIVTPMPETKSVATTLSGPSAQVTPATVKVTGDRVYVETFSLSAVIDKGIIISLKDKASGEEFIEKPDVTNYRALQLLYRNNELLNINEEKFGSTEVHQISDKRAEILFHSWDGDGVLVISADDSTGDMLIEPSASTSRPGVLACRWNMTGLKQSLEIVAPFFQGIRMKLPDPLIKNIRWGWPFQWEAGLAILQSSDGGFWIHTRDDKYRFKALQTGTPDDPYTLGFDSEAYGPIDDNLSAGGLCWRINTYKGDWKVPAEKYRQWYWQAYNLDAEEKLRQKWVSDVRFAISWCPGEPAILDALAKKIRPEKVLIHFPNWRTDNYDENYPTFIPGESAKSFIRKGQQMGFRIMPHFNSIDMDPSNPVYAFVRDFPYRSVETKQLQGWSWYNRRVIGVPESNANRLKNRDKKVMVKIHPGLGLWRSILGQNMLKPVTELNLNLVFIDVTLCIWNIHNCLVESMPPTEGMNRLIKHISELGPGLVVGGEGLNEITAQRQSFSQVHLFRSSQDSIEGIERTGGCNLNQILFGRLVKTFGYSNLSGKNKDTETRMQLHLDHGAIPTITINSADEISNPNPAVRRMIDISNG